MPTQLLLVTLDSADPQLVRQWAAEGELPTLASLLSAGTAIDINNYPGFGNGVFWPSLNTGGDPSHHGRYFRRQLRPPAYSLEVFEPDDFRLAPFWKTLDDEGLAVGVVDPVESPTRGMTRGIEVMEWFCHGRTYGPLSSPPELVQDLIKRYGDDPFDGSTDGAMKRGMSLAEVLDAIESRIKVKTDAMLEFLTDRDWDLFSVAYGEPHDVGHLAWHLHAADTGSSASDGPLATSGNPLKTCYRLLDDSIQRLQATLAPGGRTIVMMGPGIERNVSANPLLPEILSAFQRKRRSRFTRLAVDSLRSAARAPWLPRRLREQVRTSKARAGARLKGRSGARYFSIPHNDNAGAIRINVAGRDPHGVVPPGRPYEELCAELTDRLLQVRDATGRKPLVSRVVKTHEVFSGPQLETLPDLMAVWNRDADTSAAVSPDFGRLVSPRTSHRSGDHSIHGLVISDMPLTTDQDRPLYPAEVTPLLLEAARRSTRLS